MPTVSTDVPKLMAPKTAAKAGAKKAPKTKKTSKATKSTGAKKAAGGRKKA
jgi:hypothetical protein